jgi:hypothetical protein
VNNGQRLPYHPENDNWSTNHRCIVDMWHSRRHHWCNDNKDCRKVGQKSCGDVHMCIVPRDHMATMSRPRRLRPRLALSINSGRSLRARHRDELWRHKVEIWPCHGHVSVHQSRGCKIRSLELENTCEVWMSLSYSSLTPSKESRRVWSRVFYTDRYIFTATQR